MKANKTFEFSPENVGDMSFRIPIYQRLYSWERPEIKQLLDDLYSSFEKGKDRDYYIGNLVLSPAGTGEEIYDVIDGQQRLTTLYIIAHVYREYYPEWDSFIAGTDRMRIIFNARESIDELFNKLYTSKNIKVISADDHTLSIINGIKVVKSYRTNDMHNAQFAEYVYRHTKLLSVVLNYNNRELNKYFEVMNNRGVQLEKHEILKARLLSNIILKEDQLVYATIWNACSQMDGYIEDCFSAKYKNLIINSGTDVQLIISGINKEIRTNIEDIRPLSLYKVLEMISGNMDYNFSGEEKTKNQIISDMPEDKISSICNFPDFLLHVYKLFSGKYSDVKIHNKDLLDIIAIPDSDSAEKFSKDYIRELLKYRILFDNNVIKGIYRTSADYKWQIKSFSEYNIDTANNRKHDVNKLDLEQIQSMLDVSTQQDHWLTPFLKYIECSGSDVKSCVAWLEKLDAGIALQRLKAIAKSKLLEFADRVLNDFNAVFDIPIDEYNDSWDRGIDTERYWYFKIDYCLWKEYMKNNTRDDKIKNYRFKPNNSLEHVHAQSERNTGDKWDHSVLNSLGNLCLISVSANSEFNDQSFSFKKADFESRSKKWGYESLKLFEIYQYNEWNMKNCREHEVRIKALMRKYHLSK